MEARLVGEELSKCRKGEGVNAYQNCKHLADLYLELLRDASVSVRDFYCLIGIVATVMSDLTFRSRDTSKSTWAKELK